MSSDHDRRCCPHLHERVTELEAELDALRTTLATAQALGTDLDRQRAYTVEVSERLDEERARRREVEAERDSLREDDAILRDGYTRHVEASAARIVELEAEMQAKVAHQAACLREAHRACARLKRRWRQSSRLMYTNQFAAQRDVALGQLAKLQAELAEWKFRAELYRSATEEAGMVAQRLRTQLTEAALYVHNIEAMGAAAMAERDALPAWIRRAVAAEAALLILERCLRALDEQNQRLIAAQDDDFAAHEAIRKRAETAEADAVQLMAEIQANAQQSMATVYRLREDLDYATGASSYERISAQTGGESMTTDRDELRQLAKQLLDYNTCHDGVVDQAAEAIPTLLDQLAAAESRVTRLREALQAVVSAGKSYHRGDDALIVLPYAVWHGASEVLRVLEEPR